MNDAIGAAPEPPEDGPDENPGEAEQCPPQADADGHADPGEPQSPAGTRRIAGVEYKPL
ncbi:MAG TPA: hypothetical protein VHF06_06285 [Pseudonocardiaceae bacterium]|jgi:hypothetical protein|nr:hypothetical protein [Pseudonocardiaceae bacterium]